MPTHPGACSTKGRAKDGCDLTGALRASSWRGLLHRHVPLRFILIPARAALIGEPDVLMASSPVEVGPGVEFITAGLAGLGHGGDTLPHVQPEPSDTCGLV